MVVPKCADSFYEKYIFPQSGYCPNSLGVFHYICIRTKIYKNLAKMKEESAVSGHDRLKGNISVRFLQFFVPLAKRKENSEFWWAEHRVEVIRRMMVGKYASFEPLSASCW